MEIKMNSNDISKAYGLYQCGMSLSQVAPRFNVNRKMLHYFFKKYGLKCRSLKKLPTIREYKGEKYSYSQKNEWRKTKGDRKLLHRQMWEDLNGPLTDSQEIIFLDGNKANVSIENLSVRTISENVKERGFINNQHTKKKEVEEYWSRRNGSGVFA